MVAMNICGKDIRLYCTSSAATKIQDLGMGDVLVGGTKALDKYPVVHTSKFSGIVYPISVGEHQFCVSETTKLLVRCMVDCEYGKRGMLIRVHPESIVNSYTNYELVKPGTAFSPNTLFPSNIACLGRWVSTHPTRVDTFYKDLKKRKQKTLKQLLERNAANLLSPSVFPGIVFSPLETRFSFLRGILHEAGNRLMPCVDCPHTNKNTMCKYVLMFYVQSIQIYHDLAQIIGSLGYHYTRNGLLTFIHGSTKKCLRNLLQRKQKSLPQQLHSCQFRIEHSKPDICHNIVLDVPQHAAGCVYGPDFVQI